MGQEKYTTEKRKWKQVSERERYQLEILLNQGLRPSEAAKSLKRDRRTIEREIKRGSVKQLDSELREHMRYCADAGQRVKEERAMQKGRALKIGKDHALVAHIENKIGEEKYSPDAVIGEISAKGLKFEVTICTKTLYNYIDQGLFLNISNADLAVKKKSGKRSYRRVRKVALTNREGRSIEDRPKGVDARQEAGHWEMDCVVGKTKESLLVLTERKSRYEMIFKLKRKTQEQVIKTLDKLERKYGERFSEIFKSITMDNGCEFLNSKGIEASVLRRGVQRTVAYYAHPYSSWERGSNENANKLIRRFVPKGADISKYTQKEINRIEQWMNNYPRRIFDYRTASQVLALL